MALLAAFVYFSHGFLLLLVYIMETPTTWNFKWKTKAVMKAKAVRCKDSVSVSSISILSVGVEELGDDDDERRSHTALHGSRDKGDSDSDEHGDAKKRDR